MSYYLIQQIAAIPNISVRVCTEVVGGAGRRPPGEADPARQPDRPDRDGRRRGAVRVHRRRAAAPTGWTGRWPGQPRFRADRARPDGRRGRTLPTGWALDRPRITWRPACPGCSWPATRGPSRPSGSPPRWARAPWPSCSCTGIWRSYDHGDGIRARRDRPASRPVQPGRAAHAVPVREADRRAAGRGSAGKATSRSSRPGPVFAEGDPATCFFVLLEGGLVLSRRVGSRRRRGDPHRSDRGVYSGAFTAYFGDRIPQMYTGSMRVTEPSRFFVLDADVFGRSCGTGSRWPCTCWRACSSGTATPSW